MTPQDKLAEETLYKLIHGQYAETEIDDYLERLRILTEAMQAYHEAKMREVTDDDIISYAKSNIKSSIPLVEAGIIVGAKDLRDGKIKHTNPR